MYVLLHRLHYALPGWEAAAERRDAQDEFHRQGRGLTATSMRTTALLSTAWAARLIRDGSAASLIGVLEAAAVRAPLLCIGLIK
jgi:hypothetical protein